MVGVDPKLKIIQATHTAELAIRFGRKAKNVIDSKEYLKFLKQPSKKIAKPLVGGKQHKAENTLQLGWAVPSPVGC
ncbi:MAG: hypothetical protein CM15mV55_130 [uncultured marine virus]|nr:MAG: hypothetical protein CM15mV55_130 [uncultured marine virus]